MLNMIRIMHNQQGCQINFAGKVFDGFPIHTGTRQGCPLSPLLSALVLDVLLRRIRIVSPEVAVRAFADAIVLVIPDIDIGHALWECPGNSVCRRVLVEATRINLGWGQHMCLFELFCAGVDVRERAAHIEFVGRSLTPALLPAGTATEQWHEACVEEATSASGVDAWLRIEREKAGSILDLDD